MHKFIYILSKYLSDNQIMGTKRMMVKVEVAEFFPRLQRRHVTRRVAGYLARGALGLTASFSAGPVRAERAHGLAPKTPGHGSSS